MSRVRLVARAQRDLIGIRNWIGQDNPPRAVSYVAELVEHFRRLAEQPLIGRARPELGRAYRSMPHGNFVILYRPAEQGIVVMRVIHAARNLGRGIQ